MQGIKLSERIKYLHCKDPEGNHGVMILSGKNGYPTKVASIECQSDFKFWLRNFRLAEENIVSRTTFAAAA